MWPVVLAWDECEGENDSVILMEMSKSENTWSTALYLIDNS